MLTADICVLGGSEAGTKRSRSRERKREGEGSRNEKEKVKMREGEREERGRERERERETGTKDCPEGKSSAKPTSVLHSCYQALPVNITERAGGTFQRNLKTRC